MENKIEQNYKQTTHIKCMDCDALVEIYVDPNIAAKGGKVHQYIMCKDCYKKSLNFKDSF